MKVATLQEPYNVTLKDVEMPELGAEDVLIRVRNCGISGTDVRIYQGVVNAEYPIILGQEFSGMIEDVGGGVKDVLKGERVVVEPVIYCGKCSYCRVGLYTLCEDLRVLGVNADGGFAEYVKVPKYAINKVPSNLSLEEAALTVPVAVALYAVKRGHVSIGDNVVVFGGGAIGLSTLQLAKRSGAEKVVMVEPVALKRRLAENLGAYRTYIPEEAMEEVREGLGRVDVVIETSGSSDALRQSLELVSKNGRVVVVGVYGRKALLPADALVKKNLTVVGSWLYPHLFQEALTLIGKGIISVKEYVSSKYPFTEIREAFKEAIKPETIRVIVNI